MNAVLTWTTSNPVPVRVKPPKPERSYTSTPELEQLRSALAAIPNDTDPLEYDLWRNVIFALHYATNGSDDGLALAHEFSARSSKYEPEFLDDRCWPYIGVNSDVPVTERTLYALAASYGWVDPTILDDFEVIEASTEDDFEDLAGEAPAPSKFTFMPAVQFSAGKPPGWIIKNVLPRAELVCLYGESGAGKSFMVLDLLGAIARGEDWLGHRTAKGLTCGYIAAEGAGGVKNRLTAYAQQHGIDLEDLPIAVLAGAPNFLEKADITALAAAMKAYGAMDVLVVDTLARVTAGANENSSEDMGRAIKNCERLHKLTGATIVLVHHSGKDASRGARGWSGIKGALDAELEVTRCGEDRVLSISKLKDGQGEGKQFGFRLLDVPLGVDEDGDVYGSCVVEHQAGPVRAGETQIKGKNEREIFKLIKDLWGDSGETTADEVITAYEDEHPIGPVHKRDTRRQVVQRALRLLEEKALVELRDGLVVDPNTDLGGA